MPKATVKKRRTPKPKSDYSVIPDGSFVIFRTQDPMALAVYLQGVHEFEERGIEGCILSEHDKIEAMTDRDLRSVGLMRIRDTGAH